MKVVIIGGGEVGFHAAKALCGENHDITIVDIDPAKTKRASDHIDVITVEGNGASPNTLREAVVEDADLVLSLTRTDEVNLIASQQAHKMGAKKIIARLRNEQYTRRDSIIRPESFGIDLVIHPEKAASDEIVRLVRHSYATQAMDFEGGRMEMIGFRLDKNCPIATKTIREICEENEDFRFGVVAVTRNGSTEVPWSDFIFREGDTCYFIFKKDYLDQIMEMLGKEAIEAKGVMILGGSKIGRNLAETLQNEMSVRLIDANRDKAERLASTLPNTMVLNSDGTDVEFLKSENIHELDSFISVTQSEQTNLLCGLLAHHLGTKQTIIHINTTEYLPVVQEIGIGCMVSKNISTVNAILQNIKSGFSDSAVTSFEELEVDVLEFSPEPGSKVMDIPLSEVHFPKDSIVGIINHHGHLSIARGSSQLTEDDIVLVFAKQKAIPKLRKLFSA
ncbi:MAG: Trk system potassium transporter TrkA [Candidatus Marinimicrobia bacterium]|jgi:trk system potassium uptake protein TrkA|nr:Trk system potassium transporter TrkA [Candidatus Neomarinimicrobiota bacterium]MBT3618581.1 Trk system potassium transporter TrkA [Candidatus Neomarinimicrobiota bacterium]MBT3828808.1 Trk system potassium transporter TrkA [Candidatus Neomarinimicrobiota bacterium]MBT3996830.1 Trk system potassium transporter TrkA [Candidatus Neomarinimicrobiota bacterium]MBT4281019.1 Trk system potassium transporter TrkA [Candidatus Neomarinimicrobiota bacterium]